MGPDALREPGGPLPADPAEDANLSPELLALKQEAERRLAEWQASGQGLGASSLADAAVFFSTGLGDAARHDIEIIFFLTGSNEDLSADEPQHRYRDGSSTMPGNGSPLTPKTWSLLANPVLPHSAARSSCNSADPAVPPTIR